MANTEVERARTAARAAARARGDPPEYTDRTDLAVREHEFNRDWRRVYEHRTRGEAGLETYRKFVDMAREWQNMRLAPPPALRRRIMREILLQAQGLTGTAQTRGAACSRKAARRKGLAMPVTMEPIGQGSRGV